MPISHYGRSKRIGELFAARWSRDVPTTIVRTGTVLANLANTTQSWVNNTMIGASGGTLTAPILEQFKGMICMGGTVRSHLGILCREYGIPCFMNAKITGIKEGETVEMEATAAAKTAEAYQKGEEMTGNIWKRA